MLKHATIAFIVSAAYVLVSCTAPSHHPSIVPESLLDSSEERVSFPIEADSAAYENIRAWVVNNHPAYAELHCQDQTAPCRYVAQFLTKKAIRFTIQPTHENASSIQLFYQKHYAKACSSHQFGCSSATNAIHMISNQKSIFFPR